MAACLRSAVRRTTGAETSPAASFSVSLEYHDTSVQRGYAHLRFRRRVDRHCQGLRSILAAIARAPFLVPTDRKSI